MLTHQLIKDNQLFKVEFKDYAKKHHLKDFQKKYKGKSWEYTERSIFMDLSRLSMENNTTQNSAQIDELKHCDGRYLAKYDFKIAATRESTKGSGNRCVLYIEQKNKSIEILLIYNKNQLPKNKDETVYIMDEIKNNYPEEKIQNLIKKTEKKRN